MADLVLIPLGGGVVLELTREEYEAHLRPIAALQPAAAPVPATDLVAAKALARSLNLPVSSIYEHARAGRIPCVRIGRRTLFNPSAVLAALSATGRLTGGHA